MTRAKRTAKALDRRARHFSRRKAKRARRTEILSSQSATDRTVETTDSQVADGDEESANESSDDDGLVDSDDSAGIGGASIALQQLQDLMKRTERKDNFEKSFKKRIRNEERRLLRLSEEEKERRKTEVEEFQSRFASIAAKALAPPGTPPTLTHNGIIRADVLPENHPLQVRARALAEGCKSIVKGHERLTEYASKIEPLPDLESAWGEDYEELERLAALGHEATEMEVKNLLSYNGEHKSRRAKWKRRTQWEKLENDGQLQAMLEMGREALSDRDKCQEAASKGWRVVAHRVERGLQEMVKALPDEEESNSEDDSQS